MRSSRGWVVATASAALIAGLALNAGVANAADACTPGKTKKIAFMLKQQTAFRYLNADVPFFKKTAEAAGYEVMERMAADFMWTLLDHAHPARLAPAAGTSDAAGPAGRR